MVVPIASGLAALIIAYLVVIPAIRYRITERRLLITVLGIPVRWVSLKNIRYISDFSRVAAEHWPNTHNPHGRQLYVRKYRGLFGSLLITPQKRFVFKAELEKAVCRINPNAHFDDTGFYSRSDEQSRLSRGAH